jgi:outer membrane lipoprotein SlyB
MAREKLSPINVAATYDDMEAARKAIAACERAGVDGDDISLLGRRADVVAHEQDTRDRDAHLTGDIAKKAGEGGALGTLAGALAGTVAFAIPGIGPGIGAGIWAATLGGAIAGGAVGGVAGGISAMPQTEDWELTYDDVREGKVLVVTHAEDEAQAEKQAQILRAHNPVKVELFDGQGKRIDA